MVLISQDLLVAEVDERDGQDDQKIIEKARKIAVVLADDDIDVHQRELQHEEDQGGEITGLSEQHREADKADVAEHRGDACKRFGLKRNAEQDRRVA